VIDHDSFNWQDGSWRSMAPEKMIIYELHAGTVSPEGTFDGLVARLDDIAAIGFNAIEIMPVAQFPGDRNWGYDGVFPFAVQNSYGGPDGLKNVVNACHSRGLAVILDVVYNHFGPEGNYTADFGPYFTDKYVTPWGKAINYDDAGSENVRRFFIENVIYWFTRFHIDALRLDAIHGIFDASAHHILTDMAIETNKLNRSTGRNHYLIAESDLNNPIIVQPIQYGGYGLDAQWLDDFHHSVHTLLTAERNGYYADFGSLDDLKKCLMDGFVFDGKYSVFRKHPHGSSSRDIPSNKFVAFIQNHDQVGNRVLGERLSTLIDFEGLKLAAGMLFVSPFIPLVFMGEEYAEETPFLYFTSHSDKDLGEAVYKGRKKEFEAFVTSSEPPDPQSPITFDSSKLLWSIRKLNRHHVMLNFYTQLIHIRKHVLSLLPVDKRTLTASIIGNSQTLLLQRGDTNNSVVFVGNFSLKKSSCHLELPAGDWEKIMDSRDTQWAGPGTDISGVVSSLEQITLAPRSFCIFKRRQNNG
jgi:maltooligosyltrehalose trehalohydrolase